MNKILAIGGAVIKTAKPELKEIIMNNKVEMLIHNGGSIFHDFQQELDPTLEDHSYPITELLEDYECNRLSSEYLWDWILGVGKAPEGSITRLCENKKIPVLLFTVLGADFWQLFVHSWISLADKSFKDFEMLCYKFRNPFHYICMGSAVVHPEVFLKAVAVTKPKEFRADVVDFLDMYRPRTRVAKYGKYYQMSHKEFLDEWLNKGEL